MKKILRRNDLTPRRETNYLLLSWNIGADRALVLFRNIGVAYHVAKLKNEKKESEF